MDSLVDEDCSCSRLVHISMNFLGVVLLMCDANEAYSAIVAVLDWIDDEGRDPDWWEVANLKDAIKFLHLGSTDLAARLAEYARVPQDDRLKQTGTGTLETTQALRRRLDETDR